MESKTYSFLIEGDGEAERLDSYVARRTGISRHQVQGHIQEGYCLLNGDQARPSRKLKPNDNIEYNIPPSEPAEAGPEDIPLNITYEDSDLIVIDKPAGMVVHPAAGNSDGTLVNALLHHCKDLAGVGGVERPGIVHRLDKDTSGLLVVAKNDQAHQGLSEQFAVHSIEREYRLLVFGAPKENEGQFDAPLIRHPKDRKRFTSVLGKGKHALTHWRVLARYGSLTYCAAVLATGRTHQIRVHFSDAGFPVVGDPVYTHPRRARHLEDKDVREAVLALKRQALHAAKLGFIHPVTGENLQFSSDLPADMSDLIAFLNRRYGDV